MVEKANKTDTAKVLHINSQILVRLPMTQATGKVRIKSRNFFSEYGIPVATRSSALNTNCYVEWQIGYDLLEKGNSSNTSLSEYSFINYKGERKLPYELSEIVYYSYCDGLISKPEILEAYDYIRSLKPSNLLDVIDSMRITRTNPVETTINEFSFYEMKVAYPLIVHRFGKYDIYAEITNKEKQRAVGVQPMLYVCLPVTSMDFERNPIGRILDQKESASWVITEEEARLSIELFKMFGMLSEKHRHDVLQIMKTLFELD